MNVESFIIEKLKKASPTIAEYIKQEDERQKENIELIASENFPSEAVKLAMASSLVAKYTEGYPTNRHSGKTGRYYGGCQIYDEMEEYCCQVWRQVFNTDYHVNVQPHSGSNANLAAFMSVLKPGDTFLSMNLNNGGHLTHGSKANFSGKIYNPVFYNVDDKGFIDYEDIETKAYLYHPKLILAGASAYSRIIDFERISKIAKENEAIFMVDMAHIAGLVATGEHPSPFEYADIITTTTQKTLRGPRGGLIFCKKELSDKIDSSVFPGCQGGPIQNIIAAKSIAAEEAMTDEFKSYIQNVKRNAKVMANEFVNLGYDVVTGGTDNHLFVIDFSKTHPNLTGKQVQDTLDTYRITVNKNCVPGETRNPTQTSGIRIGTAAMTTKFWTDIDFISTAKKIDSIIKTIE